MMEKIDIINGVIYVYDENMELIKSIELNVLSNLDLTFLDGSKLFTLNISNPVKRVIKFYELEGVDTKAIFEETLYENMTEKQVIDFDNFIMIINNLI